MQLMWDLKLGFPPRLLDISAYSLSSKLGDLPIKLNGEQLIVTPKDLPGTELTLPKNEPIETQPSTSSQSKSQKSDQPSSMPTLKRKPNDIEDSPPEVPISHLRKRLILRVMPDDNSCLFRSLGLCLLGGEINAMTELRSIVAQTIQDDPERFTEAMLERPRDKYCQWIQREDSWGGYVDTMIIAEHFGVGVVTIDVQNGNVFRYNENAPSRCFIIYSGIHYDALAAIPDGASPNDTARDQVQFGSEDDRVLQAAEKIATILKSKHYFTDTAGFKLKCEQCGWKGKGEKSAQAHNNATGHIDFTEA